MDRHFRGVLVAFLVAACSSPAGTGGPPPSPTPPPGTTLPTSAASVQPTPPGEPVGLIAIGHSGINSDNVIDAKGISWATSTLEGVHSVYLRMVEVLPETEGHVANAGLGGSKAAQLSGQARTGLRIVPVPRLVLVYSFENDIRCAEDETPYVAEYGAALTKAFDTITTTSPESSILIVGEYGRPAGYAALFEDRPADRVTLGGSGPCDMFDPTGKLVPDKVRKLTTMVELYEAEIVRVCALYPQCHTDGGVFATYKDSFEDLAGDLGHLNARGQAKLAELIWPKVAEILGLPTPA